MSLFLQRLFDGLQNGAIYAALAIALTIVYRASGVLNLAQGEMAMFSSFLVVVFVSEPSPATWGSEYVASLGIPWPVWAAILAAMALSALAGAVLERTIIRPLDHSQPLDLVGATMGLFLLVSAGAEKLWSGRLRTVGSPFPSGLDDYIPIGGARLRYEALGIVATLLAVVGVLALIHRRTRLGLAFRAVSSAAEAAPLVGIRVGRVLMAGWALAAALGALAGGLVAHSIGVDPDNMARLLIFALAAAALGGLDSPGGALIGGFAFGIGEAMLMGYVPFVSSDVAIIWALGALVVVLMLRPRGLFGRAKPAVQR